eukprot:CAMPEP_0117750646 /NCGR_PEP_ID=MMETSP0947-20121206/10498_1 /TAXON_ID=44440 /ORGANISM="Chattonella subsalsa, Strain CCMP2191" /LENGTH=2124 /DNA_ID=CAMNT_0005568865 /DNA_START=100 /DNA_END=6474 /DNA_ORIENTATION=+
MVEGNAFHMAKRFLYDSATELPEITSLSVACGLVGLYTLFGAAKFARTTVFLAGAAAFGLFCYNELFPNFEAGMPVSRCIGVFVAVLGGLVGGIVSLLLKKFCMSLTLGVLIAFYILLLDNGRLLVTSTSHEFVASGLVIVCMLLGCLIYYRSERLGDLVCFPLFGSLLVALGVDMVHGDTMIYAIDSIYQMTWPSSSTQDNSIQLLMLGALGASVVGFIVQACVSGAAKQWKSLFSGYQKIQDGPKASYSAGKQKTLEYPVDQEYNFFDPAALPVKVSEYSRVVLDAADELGNFFGFQDDNVRNQTEHLLFLLCNHKRFTKVSSSFSKMQQTGFLPQALDLPPSSLHSVHAKLFSNYKKWCTQLGVAPKFLSQGQNAENFSDLSLDILLFLFVWGESGNLRHMPEVECFLFHKMMQEYMVHRGPNVSALYPGFFLDHVVTPIYDVVNKARAGRADHVTRRNYDDFNEFFWSPECLRYTYRDIDLEGSPEASHFKAVPIAKALSEAPKSFVEKRSLLGFVLAFNRLYEFLFLAFQFQSCFAFGQYLVWPIPYYLQIMSTPFLTMNIFAITRVMMEVWMSFPGIKLDFTATAGLLLRLIFRYVLLAYQCVYLMWSFEKGAYSTNNFSTEVQGSQPPLYWWWQYIYISSIVVAIYIFEALLQVFPRLSTALYTIDNDYVQALMNVIAPSSRNYVGKVMHDKQSNVSWYFLFWISLLSWKFYFSYLFEVQSCILPSILYFDDYMNMPNTNLVYTLVMIFIKWVPMVLVYIIDGSIWFSVWVAGVGIWVGFKEKLGEVTSIKTIREHFMAAPEAFCDKILDPAATAETSFGSGMNLVVDERSNLAPRPITEAPKSALKNIGETQTKALMKENVLGANKLKTKVSEYLDVRTAKWAAFGTAWNEIVNHLRQTDLISNQERNMLKFHSFQGFSKPVYLPVFQMAGFVEQASILFQNQVQAYYDLDPVTEEDKRQEIVDGLGTLLKENITMYQACEEAWELASWVLVEVMGQDHAQDFMEVLKTIEGWFQTGVLLKSMKCGRVAQLMVLLSELVTIMNFQLPRRKAVTKGMTPPPESTATPKAELKRNLSSSALTGKVDNVPNRYKDLTPRIQDDTDFRDRTRDMMREKLRTILNIVKEMVVLDQAGDRGLEVNDRISFILSHGFLWNDYYASNRLDQLAENPLVLAVIRKLFGLLCVTPAESEPSSPEAQRRLTYFVNTLFMDLPKAPPLEDMSSWTVMTPFYSEDVMLNKADLEIRNPDGLTTLTYLQALYRNDWLNFLERNGIQDETKIYSKKYIQETRMWASIRAQTLARTCEGMMYYEKALRLLGNLENIQVDKLEALIKQKFGYVITCQIYGKMKRNQDPKADDIDYLLGRYPNLRVAYIDELRVGRENSTDYFSVLIKKEFGKIKEIYRVKLPGNPVMGEGKPENQNHAIIFSRGEYVQAIDMNQDGYFEEGLKMRNMLEEFGKSDKDVPTTILGFREHIFTGSVSSLANYMALQELSFVTVGQRVLNSPLRLRLHYGHPDLFDKIFFMTRGGISKASKGINLSEDIFAGYNNQLRGGNVQYKEYMHVGKGRDVGMQQIYKFEAKLSQGAAEQSLSRDVHRMCARLDFCRLLTYYFGALGFYINSFLTVFTVVFVVYLSTYSALFGFEAIGDRRPIPEGVLQLALGGMGILQTIPMFSTIAVENSVSAALGQILQVFVSGGPLYFMFHIQTKSHYFVQTLLAGNAQYRPTGRGFITRHSPYDENFRFFASSHLYLGFELMCALIIMGLYTHAHQYWGRTWSLWLAVFSFLLAPFWFNPASLEWHKVEDDYKKFIVWMTGSGGTAQKSWKIWFKEEMTFYKQVSPIQKLCLFPRALLFLGMGLGICGEKLFTGTWKDVLHVSAGTACFVALYFIHTALGKMSKFPSTRRMLQTLVFFGFIGGLIFVEVQHKTYAKYIFAVYYFIAAITTSCSIMGVFLELPYFIHDMLISHFIFILLFVASALQIPAKIQTWLLFNNALSRGVAVDDILKFASKAKAKEDDDIDVAELRKRVAHQEALINTLIANGGASKGGLTIERQQSTGDIMAVVSPEPARAEETKEPAKSSAGMSGGMMRRNLSFAKLNAIGGPSVQNFQFEQPTNFPARN